MKTRPWLARATLVIVLLGFVALAVRVAVSLGERDLLEQKLAGGERYIYYRLAPTSGPKFELQPSDRSLRLVTHVVVPPGAYDPEREVEYGVRVVVELATGKAWTRDIYTRSRQSKARWNGAIWLDENTFVPDSSRQLTDDRLLVIALPSEAASAKVTLLGDAREGYVRAYAPAPREDIGRRVRDLPDTERARIAALLGHLPWDRIAAPAQLQALQFTERRLSAEGKDGIDYTTQPVFTTAFRLRDDAVLERGLLLTAARAAAINVVGPATIALAITRSAALPAAAGTLEIELVGETPVAPTSIALPALGARGTHTIDIPAGVFTVTLSSTSAARVELASPMPLAPDEQVSTAFLVEAGKPIEIVVDGPPDLLSRVLRIDLRALASEPTVEGTAPIAPSVRGELVIETLGEDGVIATARAPYETPVSRFELAKLPGKLAASVCEPASIRFVVPPGGRRVRIASDARALVQVQTPIAISPPADRLEPPYDAIVPVRTRWRYARFVERGWLPIRPRAIAPDRIALIATQARLELREVAATTELAGTAMNTGGGKQAIVERVAAADAARFVASWNDGHYTRLAGTMKLDLGRLPTRATIRYRVAENVGASARIVVDGVATTETISAARGSWRLPPLTGVHEVAVETDAKVELLIDRPGAGELYALRTVTPVRGRVRVEIEKRGAQQQNVNIVLYTPRPASTANVRVFIDGGAPARVSGAPLAMWTIADRTVTLPAADRPATLGFADTRGGVLYARRIVVALGDDLAPGRHTLEIVAGDAWLRMFTLDGAADAPRARQWREASEESP